MYVPMYICMYCIYVGMQNLRLRVSNCNNNVITSVKTVAFMIMVSTVMNTTTYDDSWNLVDLSVHS